TGEGDLRRLNDVTLPGEQPQNEVLAPLWARAKIENLMSKDLAGIQRGTPDPAMKEEILGLGLRYRLLTQFTSFVAVEHLRITEGDTVRTVPVPVEMPEGVSHEGVFGRGAMVAGKRMMLGRGTASYGLGGAAMPMRMAAPATARPTAPPPASGRPPRIVEKIADLPNRESDGLAEKKPVDARAQQLARKLAAELHGLAEKVTKEGTGGNLTIGKIQVKAGRVEVRVQLTGLSDEVIEKLTKLGFKELARAKSVKLVIGTIDVAKLEALALLDVVHRVDSST
ncbi:MAG: hypothetical protein HQ581_12505, partial [Planctomycetes bacterium]|nr:hypothetical protein [Planctomycetota bacterium]